MDREPFIHSICQCEVWTKHSRHHYPCSVCACDSCHLPCIVSGFFKVLSFWGGKQSYMASVKTVTTWTGGKLLTSLTVMPAHADLGSSLCTVATWGPHLDVAAIGLLLYGYLFPEKLGTRRLGKDSAKHAVKPKPRSWNRHLHGVSSQTPLTLCPVPRDSTNQTHHT